MQRWSDTEFYYGRVGGKGGQLGVQGVSAVRSDGHSLANSTRDNSHAMAKPLLARVAFVLCCWETLATAQVTKVNATITFIIVS
jgi:hypothetical protein